LSEVIHVLANRRRWGCEGGGQEEQQQHIGEEGGKGREVFNGLPGEKGDGAACS